MGSAIEKNIVRGLIVPDRRINPDSIWSGESSYDTADLRAGVPVAAQSSEMVLGAAGTIAADYDLRIQEAGIAGPYGATAVYKPAADSDYIGWDPPQAVAGFEVVDWKTANGYEHTTACVTADGWVLVAAAIQGGASASIVVHGRDPDTGLWSNRATVVIQITTNKLTPALVALPNGRVHIYYHVYDATTGIANIAMEYSEDNGDTWLSGSSACLAFDDLDEDAISLCGAYKDGEFVLVRTFASGGTVPQAPDAQQYASYDGASFSLVSDTTGTVGPVDICAYVGGFISACAYDIAGTETIQGGRIGSAFQPLFGTASLSATPYLSGNFGMGITNATLPNDTELLNYSASVWGNGTVTITASEDGTIYLISGADEQGIMQSIDGGTTWRPISDANANGLVWCGHASTNHLLERGKAVWFRGRIIVASQMATVNAAADASIFATTIGGYSTVTLPAASTGYTRRAAFPWYRNWVASDLPDATATFTNSGIGTSTITSGALVMTAASGFQENYDAALTGDTQATGFVCYAKFKVPAVGDNGAPFIEMRTSDTNTYTCRVDATEGKIRLRDEVASTTIDETLAALGNQVVAILFAADGNNCRAWYRLDDGTQQTERKWIELGSETSLTAAAASSNRLRFGYAGGTTGTDGRFYEFHYQCDSTKIRSLLTTATNPADLSGVPLSTNEIYLGDTLKVKATGGPVYRNDSWSIPATSDYAIENVLPSVAPSPRVPWRSDTTTAGMEIAWDLDPDAGTPGASLIGNKIYGVYLSGINFREFDIEIHDNSAWSKVATVECSLEVSYQRRGNTVTPSTSAPGAGRYLVRNELAGGWFQFTGGTLRRIIGNTEGAWIAPANGKVPTLFLEGVSGSEGTGIATGRIWFPRVLATFLAPNDYIRGIRLVLRNNGSAAPADGYFEIGQAVIGPLVVWGLDYENRARNIETNVDVVTAQDGSRRSRVLGPARRTVEFTWPNGLPTRHIQGSSTSDNWIAPSGETYAIAARHDVADLMQGLIEEIDGPATPIVYCPYVATGEATSYLNMRQMGALYGRLISIGTIDTINGDEHIDEFVRLGAAVIEEEL